MKISCSPSWALGPVGLTVAALLASALISGRARAYGGLWSSPAGSVEHSATQVLFVDNPGATVTAVVQVEYSGPSQSFAWLIPVPGTATVEVSSRTVFERLQAATAPQYWVEVAVEGECMPEDDEQAAPDAGAGAGAGAGPEPGVGDPDALPVDVLEQRTIGPYDYVSLVLDPSLDDPADVAVEWLSAQGYDVTGTDTELLSAYLEQGFNLLAFKLTSGMDVGAIRPVSLTYESERPTIPLRPTAVAAQQDMGLQVWVIGPSQAVPVNYKSLVLNDARLDWTSAQAFARGTAPAGGVGPFGPLVSEPSNYYALVRAAADEADGQGFVTELGGPASQYREAIWSALDDVSYAGITGQSYADGLDAVLAAKAVYEAWDGWRDALEAATTLPDDVTLDDFARDPDAYRGSVEVDTEQLLRLLDERVVGPVADTAALFYRGPYLTRLYTALSPREMTLDPVFDYNPELAPIDSVHIARQVIECSPTLRQPDAPWRMELPQGGVVVGEGKAAWPVDEDSQPANLAIVELSTTGSGKVVTDNAQDIAAALLEAGAASRGTEWLQPPQHGVPIGGAQTVLQFDEPAPMQSRISSDDGCGVAQAGARARSARAAWLSLAAVLLALRRRRARRSEAS